MVERDRRVDQGRSRARGRCESRLDRDFRADALLGISRCPRRCDTSRSSVVRRSHYRRVQRDHEPRGRRVTPSRLGAQPRARGLHPSQDSLAEKLGARSVRASRYRASGEGFHPVSPDRAACYRTVGRVGHADVRSSANALEQGDSRRGGSADDTSSRSWRICGGAWAGDACGRSGDRTCRGHGGGGRRRGQRVRRRRRRRNRAGGSGRKLGNLRHGARSHGSADRRSRSASSHVLSCGAGGLVSDGSGSVSRGRVRVVSRQLCARACRRRRSRACSRCAHRRGGDHSSGRGWSDVSSISAG